MQRGIAFRAFEKGCPDTSLGRSLRMAFESGDLDPVPDHPTLPFPDGFVQSVPNPTDKEKPKALDKEPWVVLFLSKSGRWPN